MPKLAQCGPIMSQSPLMAVGACYCGQEHVLTVPRCGMTLCLCDVLPAWQCLLCRRRYSHGPHLKGHLGCLFCGLRLAPSSLHPRLLTAPGIV